MIEALISGGQTGADRAALDVAIRHSFPHGGWCPAGRKAEDGPIGGQYKLLETPSANYLQRTEWNVRDSDATVVFTFAKQATGGSLRTIAYAQKHGKPCLHVRPGYSYQPVLDLQVFVELQKIKRLNVAGSRESKDPGIYKWTVDFLEDAFFWCENHPNTLRCIAEGRPGYEQSREGNISTLSLC